MTNAEINCINSDKVLKLYDSNDHEQKEKSNKSTQILTSKFTEKKGSKNGKKFLFENQLMIHPFDENKESKNNDIHMQRKRKYPFIQKKKKKKTKI